MSNISLESFLLVVPEKCICLGLQEQYKNRLQEYAQRSAIHLPLYKTVNEASLHAPKFRSTVEVDGQIFTSRNTFLKRKIAEQDVSKLALEHISKKIKDERCPLTPLICEVCYIMIVICKFRTLEGETCNFFSKVGRLSFWRLKED